MTGKRFQTDKGRKKVPDNDREKDGAKQINDRQKMPDR